MEASQLTVTLHRRGTESLGLDLGRSTRDGSTAIYAVVPGGLAHKDGQLRRGDSVRAVNGERVYSCEGGGFGRFFRAQEITKRRRTQGNFCFFIFNFFMKKHKKIEKVPANWKCEIGFLIKIELIRVQNMTKKRKSSRQLEVRN